MDLSRNAYSPEAELDSANYPQIEIAAPITVYSRRETDENYKGVIACEGELRIVNCPNDLQWIVQCFKGGQWRNKSFHRSRDSLIQRYGPLKIIFALPEHHDDFEDKRRCTVCGRIRGKPKERHYNRLFCLADRNSESHGSHVGYAHGNALTTETNGDAHRLQSCLTVIRVEGTVSG